MAVNYNLFSIDIISEGESLLDSGGVTLQYFIVKEMPNSIPEVEIALGTLDDSDFIEVKDLLVIVTTNNIETTYEVAIFNVNITNKVVLTGLLCKYSEYTEINSSYLGEDLDEAINSLSIRDNVFGVSKIPGGYWQFNETKIQCLLRLLRGARENSIAVLSTDSIRVIDLTTIEDPQDYIAPVSTEFIRYNKRYPDEIYKEFLDANDYAFNLTWMNKSFIGTNHYDFAHNYVSSLRFSEPPSKMLKLKYLNMIFPYEVGSTMKIAVPRFNVDSMQVLSKITQYRNDGLECNILVGIQPTQE